MWSEMESGEHANMRSTRCMGFEVRVNDYARTGFGSGEIQVCAHPRAFNGSLSCNGYGKTPAEAFADGIKSAREWGWERVAQVLEEAAKSWEASNG